MGHDIGVSVAQEMLTRHDRGQQSHGRFRIDSVTWLNGGLFNEAYAPRLIQTLLSRTPVAELASQWPNVLLPRRVLERAIDELFGPNTKPSPRMHELFQQILEFNDGKRVSPKVGRFINDRYTAIGGYGPCERPRCRCVSSTDPLIRTPVGTWPTDTSNSSRTRTW